jgi:hypothetical protein
MTLKVEQVDGTRAGRRRSALMYARHRRRPAAAATAATATAFTAAALADATFTPPPPHLHPTAFGAGTSRCSSSPR